MRELPQGGLIGKTVRAARAVSALNIPLRAAYGAYFIVLALFPALLLVLSLLRLTGLAVEDLMGLMENILPGPLRDTAEELIFNTWQTSSGTMAGLSAVTLLWSSSKGVYGLLTGLNAVYGVSEDRGYVYTRGISVVYSILFLEVLLLTLALHVFGSSLIDLLYRIDNPLLMFFVDLIDLHTVFLLAVQTLLFTAVYMVLPNRRNSFCGSLPGALVSSLGWFVFSDIFSIYITRFSGVANIYGSVYAIAISLLWLYCCISILFYGGALNRLLSDWKQSRKQE